MNIDFQLTKSINNNIFNFSLLIGRIGTLDNATVIMRSIIEENLKRASLAAVSLDKNILEKIELENFKLKEKSSDNFDSMRKEFIAYTSAKLDLVSKVENIDLKFIKNLHQKTVGISKSEFRKTNRLLPKEVSNNWVTKKIELEVKTTPTQIKDKMDKFIAWINGASLEENPVIVAGICHFKIAEIHPYDDGNGRLGRLLEYAILKSRGVDVVDYIATEIFYLNHRERYYDLIEYTIESQDLTKWLEFYTEALLTSIIATAKQLYKLSGGCVDIINNRIIKTNEIEQKIIELMQKLNQPSPTEIAEVMGTSRQNVYYFLKGLHEKGILQKVGKNTGARYKLKT